MSLTVGWLQPILIVLLLVAACSPLSPTDASAEDTSRTTISPEDSSVTSTSPPEPDDDPEARPPNPFGVDVDELGIRSRADAVFASLPTPIRRVPVDFREGSALIAECIAEFGFEFSDEKETPGSSGFLADVPLEQQARYSAVVTACRDAGVDYGFVTPDTDPEAWTMRYEAWTLVHECLIAQGFVSPTPPSLDVFLETRTWHPFSLLLGGNTAVVVVGSAPLSAEMETLLAADRACPLP